MPYFWKWIKNMHYNRLYIQSLLIINDRTPRLGWLSFGSQAIRLVFELMFITFKKLNRLLTKSILLEIRNCSSPVCNKMMSMIMAWTWFGRILFWQSHAIDSPNLLFHFFLLSICSFHCNLVWISVRFFYSCLNNRKNKLMTTYQLSDGNVFYLQRNFCFCLNSLSINLKKQPKRILQHWSYFFWLGVFFPSSHLWVCVCVLVLLQIQENM